MEKNFSKASGSTQYRSAHGLTPDVLCLFTQWMKVTATLRLCIRTGVAEFCWVHYTFFLIALNSLPEKNKDNPVRCLPDGNADAKPGPGGVSGAVEMDLAVPGDGGYPLHCSQDRGIRLMPGPRRFGKNRHQV